MKFCATCQNPVPESVFECPTCKSAVFASGSNIFATRSSEEIPTDLREEVKELMNNGYSVTSVSADTVSLYKRKYPPLFTIVMPLLLTIKLPIPFAAYFLTSLGFFIWGDRYRVTLESKQGKESNYSVAPTATAPKQ